MASVGTVGVVILALYGDRTPYYQNPYTYEQSYTKLTPLGQTQSVQLGSYLRLEYLNPGSPHSIDGIKAEIVDDRQVLVRADNGGEGGAIVDSAVALLQGLFPPTPRSRTSLANGTTVVGPLGGYQYIPIESVEPEQSIQFEGWSSCPNFEKHIQKFYDSPGFKEKAREAAPFLNAVKPYLFGIPNTLENIIYDYIHTNYIHNETYAFRLPPTFLQQAQAWVDYHEHGVFTDVNFEGIGNIAGRTILPSIITSLERIANKDDPLSLVIQETSYKPFISLFNVTGITERHPYVDGIPTYASAFAFELRHNEDGETHLRTKFKNGTSGFETVYLFGHHDDIALNEFLYRLDLTAVHDTAQWCRECGQRTARGCNLCTAGEISTIQEIGDGEKETCAGRLLGAVTSPFARILAIFSLSCFALLGAVKVFRSSRKPRLTGYDPLPTTAQVFGYHTFEEL
ncbi:phosphoglycerate mutase-like protein [Phellopilus nigrolimitatus]|nr:phosphoglycerate mutase-like protein [Phellopilus nigrolimitatus]